jgi:hypothetical protein
MAVVTRQKSTARRLVSIRAALEDTHQMLFTRHTAVTPRLADPDLADTDLADAVGPAGVKVIVA